MIKQTFQLTECITQSVTKFWKQIWPSRWCWNLLWLKLLKLCYVNLIQTKNHTTTTQIDHLNEPLKTLTQLSVYWCRIELTFKVQIMLNQNEFQQLNPINLSVSKLCRWLVSISNLIIYQIQQLQATDFNNLNYNADLSEFLTYEWKTTNTML